jgi:hypothetical protein
MPALGTWLAASVSLGSARYARSASIYRSQLEWWRAVGLEELALEATISSTAIASMATSAALSLTRGMARRTLIQLTPGASWPDSTTYSE